MIENANYNPLFSKLGILKFEDILTTNVCEFVAKFCKKELPKSFDNIFKSLGTNRAANILINIPKTKQLENFPAFTFPKIWSSQKKDVRLFQSLKTMKKKLKNLALSQDIKHSNVKKQNVTHLKTIEVARKWCFFVRIANAPTTKPPDRRYCQKCNEKNIDIGAFAQ